MGVGLFSHVTQRSVSNPMLRNVNGNTVVHGHIPSCSAGQKLAGETLKLANALHDVFKMSPLLCLT